MKINVDVECTPEEARAFLGLPDVRPMQDAVLQEIEDRMRKNLSAMDPETLFKTRMPMGVQSLEQLQKMFWSQIGSATGQAQSDDGDADK